MLASAIAFPKITFLARFCWPPPDVVTRLHSLIIEFVWGVRDGKQSRPWVPLEIASLPIPQGGLAVPSIRTELMTMAAKAIFTLSGYSIFEGLTTW